MTGLVASNADQELLLELLNTTPVAGGRRHDHLIDEAGRDWLAARGGTGTTAELGWVRRVRTALQQVVRGQEPASVLAPFVGSIRSQPTATENGLEWSLEAPADQQLAARSLLAWDHLRVTAPGRLRPCGNDECALFLIDRSKANTGRWCSMAVCGNRMKARRHYQRRRLSPI
jgi:hypothetical protein